MDLSGLKFGAADSRGFCAAEALDADGLANLQLLRLTPGVKLLTPAQAIVPANVAGEKVPLEFPVAETTPSGLKLRRYQREAIEFIERAPLGAINACDVGLGKQQPIDALVLTPRGWRAIGSLVIGDEVIGSNGKPTRVTGVFPQGVKPSYRVVFSDHTSVEAGPDHLWSVWYWAANKRKEQLLLTTQQLIDRPTIVRNLGKFSPRSKKNLARTTLHVPLLTAPVEFAPQPLPIHPYVFGQLIANGHLAGTPQLVTGARDWPEVAPLLYSSGEDISEAARYDNSVHVRVRGVTNKIRTLGLRGVGSKDKWIPRCYRESAVADRVALFRGLMDADGSCAKGSKLVYHTCSLTLAMNVKELVEGFGGIASVREYDRTSEGKPVDYQVRIRLPRDIAPFNVSAKAKNYTPTIHAHPVRTVLRVEYVRDVQSVCISVAAHDGLYTTANCILTHNTATALAVLHRHPEWRPFVVVAPLIGMSVWCGEHADAYKHYKLLVHPLRTRTPDEEKFPAACDGYFINFDILFYWLPWFTLFRSPKLVVVDESHQVRHVQPRISKAVHKLCRIPDVRKRVLLTATPVVSTVMDLYHQLECTQPGCWGKYCKFNANMLTSFGSQYGSEYRDEYGIKFGGESNVLELRARLANVMFRRSRHEVRDELPPLVRQAVRLPVEALDQKAIKQYEAALVGLEPLNVAGARLKQGTAMASALSWSKRTVAAQHALNLARQRRKVVLFCWYKRMAKYLADNLCNDVSVFGPVTGEKDIADRMAEADRFRDLELAPGECAVFIATLGAAAVSMNQLSAASAALFVDLYWVPATLLQAEGRVHREGQRASDVLVQYLLADGTMDDVMWKHLERKAKSIGTTTGDSTSKSLVEDLGGADEKSSMASLLGELDAFGQAELELT